MQERKKKDCVKGVKRLWFHYILAWKNTKCFTYYGEAFILRLRKWSTIIVVTWSCCENGRSCNHSILPKITITVSLKMQHHQIQTFLNTMRLPLAAFLTIMKHLPSVKHLSYWQEDKTVFLLIANMTLQVSSMSRCRLYSYNGVMIAACHVSTHIFVILIHHLFILVSAKYPRTTQKPLFIRIFLTR